MPANSATVTAEPTTKLVVVPVSPLPAFVATVVPLICRLNRPVSAAGNKSFCTVTERRLGVFVYVHTAAFVLVIVSVFVAWPFVPDSV